MFTPPKEKITAHTHTQSSAGGALSLSQSLSCSIAQANCLARALGHNAAKSPTIYRFVNKALSLSLSRHEIQGQHTETGAAAASHHNSLPKGLVTGHSANGPFSSILSLSRAYKHLCTRSICDRYICKNRQTTPLPHCSRLFFRLSDGNVVKLPDSRFHGRKKFFRAYIYMVTSLQPLGIMRRDTLSKASVLLCLGARALRTEKKKTAELSSPRRKCGCHNTSDAKKNG